MFKRITWMGIGMAVGATGAFRAKRKVEATIDRWLQEDVVDIDTQRFLENVLQMALEHTANPVGLQDRKELLLAETRPHQA